MIRRFAFVILIALYACSVFGQNDALLRSWRKAYPFRKLSETAYQEAEADTVLSKKWPYVYSESRLKTDSLLAALQYIPFDSKFSEKLKDYRTPIFIAGSIPSNHQSFLLDRANDNSQDAWNYVKPADAAYTRLFAEQNLRDLETYNFAKRYPLNYDYSRGAMALPSVLDREMVSTEESLEGKSLDVDESTVVFSPIGGIKSSVKADVWYIKGSSTLQLTQTALSDNWYKGGDNNMTAATVQKLDLTTYDENKKTSFDVSLELRLSAMYTQSDTVNALRVNDNLFSANIKYRYRAWNHWYYSTALYAKTPVFDYHAANSAITKSTFLAPLEANLSAGMEYKYETKDKKFQYSLMLAPVAYNMKYVATHRVDPTSFGIEEGKNALHKFGSTIQQTFTWKMSNNVSWNSRLYGFTSYDNILIEFENTFNFNVSRHFTCQLYLYPRFDDILDEKIQVKEMLSFGLNYVW